ncbi:CD99 molecule isoform X6 [Clarias gariepinus]|uniref:CD99 molecule isoform X6 n=1 Tax=Clarias gariepinus TaxID=13013 RepID=UPI00234C9BC1|nr:CD99 molecule isoform X6 [Clarias gariepinus]
MTSYMWILLFAALALTKAQELDLGDAIGNLDDPTVKPPVKKPPKESDGGFDLSDAFGDSDEPKPADPKKPVAPPKTDGGFDLSDAFGDSDEPKPADPKKPVAPPKTGGGDFGDSDLSDAAGDGYKPDPGHGGNAGDYTDTQGDQSQELYQQWLKLLMLLGDNLPEGLLAWIANSKQVIVSLLERVLELLDLAEAEKQS